MKTIYTAGYTGMTVEQLEGMMARLEGRPLLVDVRFSPRSRNPAWAGSNLRARFGADYLHVNALGNRNYRGGGPIELVDADEGARVVGPILKDRPVVLLCACKDHRECHRKDAAEALAERLGAEVRHLYPAGGKGGGGATGFFPGWA